MSNKTQLQTNNTSLSNLITTLQNKAGGGGASLEVCSTTIMFTGGATDYGDSGEATVFYTKVIDGATEPAELVINNDDSVINDVLSGSVLGLHVPIQFSVFGGTISTSEGATLASGYADSLPIDVALFLITGSQATIVIGGDGGPVEEPI